jgi:nitrous oxidase accessory protein NosD
LQTALLRAFPGDTVSVSGTCDENVRVPNDMTTVFLDGGRTAVINGVDPSRPAIDARGRTLLIEGFTITGGSSGIEVQRESKALINNNVIQNTGGSGVVVSQLGFAVLTNNTIQGNAEDGIVVADKAAAHIGFNNDTETVASPNTIRENGGNGVTVRGSSSARVVGNAISSNEGDGVFVSGVSQADISFNSIDSNGGDGVFVRQNSVVNLGESTGTSIFDLPNSTNSDNNDFGVECADGGIADGRLGTLTGNLGLTNFPASSGCINDLM